MIDALDEQLVRRVDLSNADTSLAESEGVTQAFFMVGITVFVQSQNDGCGIVTVLLQYECRSPLLTPFPATIMRSIIAIQSPRTTNEHGHCAHPPAASSLPGSHDPEHDGAILKVRGNSRPASCSGARACACACQPTDENRCARAISVSSARLATVHLRRCSLNVGHVQQTHPYYLAGRETANPHYHLVTSSYLTFEKPSPYLAMELMEHTELGEDTTRFLELDDGGELPAPDAGAHP